MFQFTGQYLHRYQIKGWTNRMHIIGFSPSYPGDDIDTKSASRWHPVMKQAKIFLVRSEFLFKEIPQVSGTIGNRSKANTRRREQVLPRRQVLSKTFNFYQIIFKSDGT